MVEATFRRIYGSELSHVHLVHDTSALDAAVSQYEKIKGLLTDLVDDYISQKRRGKEIKRKQARLSTLLEALESVGKRRKAGENIGKHRARAGAGLHTESAVLRAASKDALRLRSHYLMAAPPGAESHTVLTSQASSMDCSSTAWMAPSSGERRFISVEGGWFVPKSAKQAASRQLALARAAAARSAKRAGDVALPTDAAQQEMVSVDLEVGGGGGDKDGSVKATSVEEAAPPAPQVSVTSLTLGEWGKERGFTKKPKKVDALEFWRDYLGELLRRVREEQDKALGRLYPTAFVTFATRKSQARAMGGLRCGGCIIDRVVAARTLMSEDLSCWRAQGSPQPEEVYWPNLGYRQWERTGRDSLMWLAFVAMAAFFMIPVTAVQGLLTMNSVVSFIQSIPVANSFLTAMLPGLALKASAGARRRIFLAIVPIILTLMNKFSGCVSESAIDFGVVSKYFGFQVITVFLGSFIAGTFANQLQQFINNPASIVTIFGTSAPQTAIFFMTYIAIGALLQQPLGLVRLVPLVVFWVKSKLSATERAKARVWQNQENNYGTLIPNDTINMLLARVGAAGCPPRRPTPRAHARAHAWPRIFNQLMTGLFFFHLMELAILSIKKNFGGLLMIPLLLIDVGYWLAVHARFWRPLETLSLISAAERDAAEAAAAAAAGTGAKARYSDDEISRLYLSPSFKIRRVSSFFLSFGAAVVMCVLAWALALALASASAVQARRPGVAGGRGNGTRRPSGRPEARARLVESGCAAAPALRLRRAAPRRAAPSSHAPASPKLIPSSFLSSRSDEEHEEAIDEANRMLKARAPY
eukprot:scaffold2.g7014.t1